MAVAIVELAPSQSSALARDEIKGPNPKLEEPLDACASNLSLWR